MVQNVKNVKTGRGKPELNANQVNPIARVGTG
jgi:hypothetical protein